MATSRQCHSVEAVTNDGAIWWRRCNKVAAALLATSIGR